jgi:hypothetical protein
MPSSEFFRYDLVVSDDAAIADLFVSVDGIMYGAQGTSRRNPTDPINDAVGSRLATARALKQIARQMTRDAYAEVDEVARQQRAQSEARQRQQRRNRDRRRADARKYAEIRAMSEARRNGSTSAPYSQNGSGRGSSNDRIEFTSDFAEASR